MICLKDFSIGITKRKLDNTNNNNCKFTVKYKFYVYPFIENS